MASQLRIVDVIEQDEYVAFIKARAIRKAGKPGGPLGAQPSKAGYVAPASCANSVAKVVIEEDGNCLWAI